MPQGVSGAIKRQAGLQPFKELGKVGIIPLGKAVITSAGKLPYKAIIHVAGINAIWFASEYSIRSSVSSALALAQQNRFNSIAFPVIGSGSGGFNQSKALSIMLDQLSFIDFDILVIIVRFKK